MLMFYLAMIEEKGDKLPFTVLYTKYSRDIYRRVYGILGNREDTEDVTQNTWMIVSQDMATYRDKDGENAKAYIIGIAKNQAYMLLRQRKKEVYVVGDMDTFGIDEKIDERVMFSLCDDHGEKAILKCIEEIGEPYSDVLLYHYVHGHTLKQIAQIMGEKESTVGSRLTRGRKKLMQLLVGRGYHD